MTTPTFVNTYTSGAGNSSVSSLPLTFQTTDPTPQDTNYSVPTLWANTTLEKIWILRNFNSTGGVITANWILFSSELASIETVTGNDSVVVGPDSSNNINIVGDGTVITTSGNSLTHTETIAITGTVPVNHGGTGASTFTSGELLVGNGTSPISSTLTPTVSSITINNAPVVGTDGTNKAYVDMIASGFTFIAPVFASTTANLNATYNNGTAGVGATLTNAGTQAAFTTDGTSPSLNARILVQFQTSPAQNGVYSLTTVGDGSTNWVLTRTTDYDTTVQIKPGNLVPVQNGTLYTDTVWLQTETVSVIGTDPIEFQLFAGGALNFQVNVQTFTSSGTYTPTSGMVYCIVKMIGGGSAGGGCPGTSGGQYSVGGGGCAGEYAEGLFTAATIGASQTVTIGAGGIGSVGGIGGNGGNTSLGSLMSAFGATGGEVSSPLSSLVFANEGSPGTGGTGGYLRTPGMSGTYGQSGPTIIPVGGYGANSQFGSGGASGVGGSFNGQPAFGYGAGGSGASNASPPGGARPGGNGAPGIMIITEYIT